MGRRSCDKNSIGHQQSTFRLRGWKYNQDWGRISISWDGKVVYLFKWRNKTGNRLTSGEVLTI